MPSVDFYHGSSDPVGTAARVVRKAFGRDLKVIVLAPQAPQREQLDRLLWTHPPTGFLPHCGDDSALANETPVVLARTIDGIPGCDVLVNLSGSMPDNYSRFARLVEIIGDDETERNRGRLRFREYRAAGLEIRSHDVSEGRA